MPIPTVLEIAGPGNTMRYVNIEDRKAYRTWMRRSAAMYGALVLLIAAGVTTLAVTNAPTTTTDLAALSHQ
jgi:hypothetical protein